MKHEFMVRTLGECLVNDVPVKHVRPLELVALLSLSKGEAPRDWVLASLFEREPTVSSLPTLAFRARKMGLDVRFDRDRAFYRLEGRVFCDVTQVLELLGRGCVKEALSIYRGPFIRRSHSPFATQIRDHVERRIVRGVIESGDLSLMEEADRYVKHPELSEELVSRGGDATLSASLSRSWLKSIKTAG